MKVVILAGGRGTRFSEESIYKPKPMAEIGGMPILWHIMKSYYHYGFDDFVICGGYKQQIIKKWFADYRFFGSDVLFDFIDGESITVLNDRTEKWKVTVADTGLDTMTGGRIKRIQKYIGGEPFMMTYGDGVSDIDISRLLQHHRSFGKTATITAVRSAPRKGILELTDDTSVCAFRENKIKDGAYINAGFMVLEPEIFEYIKDDSTVFENEVLEKLASEGRLSAYIHDGFWQCMDTKREHELLNDLWDKNAAPWKVWQI